MENSKIVKNDLLTFLYRYEVVTGELLSICVSYNRFVGSHLPCKTHFGNFKRAVSQPIIGFEYFEKNEKITKNMENSKIAKSDLMTFLYRYDVITGELPSIWASYNR